MWKFQNEIKNFNQDEMACKCGCNVSAMSEEFMVKLQKLRDECGFALPINSGYRCAKHNTASALCIGKSSAINVSALYGL